MSKEAVAAKGEPKKEQVRKRGRSPSYPGIALETAIARAKQVYEQERTHAAPMEAIFKHWGYAPKSGPGLITIAALKKFGLLEDDGSGEKRKAKLTDLALRIIQDQRELSPDRTMAIREAALAPTIHSDLWQKFDGKLPSDANLHFELVRERAFTETGANEFIQEFRSTIDFAKLTESVSFSDKDENKGDPQKREGQRNQRERKQMPGTREDVFNLEEGQVVLQWPERLSPESFQDFKGWMDLVLRRAQRGVRTPETGKECRELESDD